MGHRNLLATSFCTEVGCVKIYQENNNEPYCINYDVTVRSFNVFYFSSDEAQNQYRG